MFRETVLGLMGVATLLGGCSPSGASASGAKSSDHYALSVMMGECGSTQSAVGEALQSSDKGAILQTLQAAHSACTSAAQKLRAAPIPSINSEEVAAAMDQMTSGLDQIADGVRVLDKAPKRARRIAQEGMHTYQAGLERLKRNGG